MRRALVLAVGLWSGSMGATPRALLAQEVTGLQVEREDGTIERLAVAMDRGYASLSISTFRDLGWVVEVSGSEITLSVPSRAEVSFEVGSPFFWWDDATVQLVDPPYWGGDGEPYLPVQLVTDFFPERMPDYYDYDAGTGQLRAGDPGRTSGRGMPQGSDGAKLSPPDSETPRGGRDGNVSITLPPQAGVPSPYEGVRVIWIDAGHGGADPGAVGHGVREKDVALGVARRLAALLRDQPSVEVRMTRSDDVFVDLWDRGLLATDAKGERPGVFISIHANSVSTPSTTRGFETYFLSEARTEDERRVSANENAPLSIRGRGLDAGRQSDLDFILRELRNFDHSHWSALLAEFVQEELDDFHPGPNRGVKQAPLAVLTNAIMPSVLVEVGFVTNADEARLMTRDDFQQRTAEALATAVLSFLERYPPGNGLGGSR